MEPLTLSVYYGASGCGKTSLAMKEAYELAMEKGWSIFVYSSPTHWWDGYDQQEIVIIEDLDYARVTSMGLSVSKFLSLVAGIGGPFTTKLKGTVGRPLRCRRMIFTSRFHPLYWWTPPGTETIPDQAGEILRRLALPGNVVREFTAEDRALGQVHAGAMRDAEQKWMEMMEEPDESVSL